MANDHVEYLSANVLNDGQTVIRAILLVYDCFLTLSIRSATAP